MSALRQPRGKCTPPTRDGARRDLEGGAGGGGAPRERERDFHDITRNTSVSNPTYTPNSFRNGTPPIQKRSSFEVQRC